MTAVLKTREIVDAAISKLNDAVATGAIDFAPAVIQEADWRHLTEPSAADLLAELPAIFVGVVEVTAQPLDLTAHTWQVETDLVVILIDKWDHDDDEQLPDKRQDRCEQIAQVFIGDAGEAYDLGGISGHTIEHALVVGMDPGDPIGVEVSQDQQRQLYAATVQLRVTSRSARQ